MSTNAASATSKKTLQGRVALVTGAGDGIGRATALELAREGAALVLFSRTKSKVETVAEEIKAMGEQAVVFVGDVAKEEDNKKAVELALSTFSKLHIAFNNAGIASVVQTFPEMEEKTIDSIFNTNVKGVIWGMKYQIPAILKTADGLGSIINTGSAVGLRVQRSYHPGRAIYAAAKSALLTLSHTAALENAGKLRVNVVSPGPIQTHIDGGSGRIVSMGNTMTVMGRAGTSQEVADVVVFLASDKASFVTGSNFEVDGGMHFC